MKESEKSKEMIIHLGWTGGPLNSNDSTTFCGILIDQTPEIKISRYVNDANCEKCLERWSDVIIQRGFRESQFDRYLKNIQRGGDVKKEKEEQLRKIWRVTVEIKTHDDWIAQDVINVIENMDGLLATVKEMEQIGGEVGE